MKHPRVKFRRVFDAPRAAVWRAWTDPRHLAKWWGPFGWTAPVCKFDARPGGAIRVDMKGPDGGIHTMLGTVEQVAAPRKLVFLSGVPDAAGKLMFEVRNTVTFASRGRRTLVALEARVVRATAAAAAFLPGMEAGWCQSLDKLDSMVAGSAKREIVNVRCIEATPRMIFRAWTNARHVARWWGPKGFTNTISAFEPRPGGRWDLVMHGPDGRDYPNLWRFVELEPPRRIVLEHPSRPHRFRILATFSAMGPRTLVVFRMVFAAGTSLNPKFRGFLRAANEENLDRLEAELAHMS